MEPYYRPSTLFRPCHFSEYVEESCFFFQKKKAKRFKRWCEISKKKRVDEPMASKKDIADLRQQLGGIL